MSKISELTPSGQKFRKFISFLFIRLKIWSNRDSTHQYGQFLDIQGSQNHQEVILLEHHAFPFSPASTIAFS